MNQKYTKPPIIYINKRIHRNVYLFNAKNQHCLPYPFFSY